MNPLQYSTIFYYVDLFSLCILRHGDAVGVDREHKNYLAV